MPSLNFIKMHGNGNDFVIIDMRKRRSILDISLLMNRRLGIGCDQLITLHSTSTADCALEVYNSDGSYATMCGNALRCVAALYLESSLGSSCLLSIGNNRFKCQILSNNLVEVELFPPKFLQYPCLLNSLLNFSNFYSVELVDVGNQHLILFASPHLKFDINQIGARLENQLNINISIVRCISLNNLFIETWERGSGYTLSCGSAACAAAVSAITTNIVSSKEVQVCSAGGSLLIKWESPSAPIYMSGKTQKVYSGQLYF